jgi:hypothetical protein
VKSLALAIIIALALIACGDDGGDATPTPEPTTSEVTLGPTPTPGTPPPTSAAPTAEPTPATPANEPSGFPIDPGTVLGVVEGEVGSRQLVFTPLDPSAVDYASNDMLSADLNVANRSGWNCETHYEYEGIPAVDFYIQTGTPIIATHDGTATLNIISVNNDFDRYSVDREPYLGNPDRSRAPYSPFPGPSSGLGVYVRVENTDFATEYGHMEIAGTIANTPTSAFIDGYSSSSDYASLFADVPSPRVITTVARWEVHRGDVIGMSGDSGYSEGPHIHYTVNRTGGPLRCPTLEPGFTDGGWLFN